jgi:hypothetical protein
MRLTLANVLNGKPEGKSLLARPSGTWSNNIKMDPQEVGWGGMDWIGLVYDRDRWRAVVIPEVKLWVP